MHVLTNRVPLHTWVHGKLVSNFQLHEFQNKDGWVIIHPAVIEALEFVRHDLNRTSYLGEVKVTITNTTRTPEQNAALAARLHYTDEGGVVARRSFHLVEFGGIAVDFYAWYARDRTRYPAWQVGQVASRYFDYVNSTYADGHIHGDMRSLVTR